MLRPIFWETSLFTKKNLAKLSNPKKLSKPKKGLVSVAILVIRTLTRSLQSMRFGVPADSTNTHTDIPTFRLNGRRGRFSEHASEWLAARQFELGWVGAQVMWPASLPASALYPVSGLPWSSDCHQPTLMSPAATVTNLATVYCRDCLKTDTYVARRYCH